MVFHINDYSAHLLSFATFYWGVYWLYGSGLPFRQREGSVHAAMGSYLAVASLTYNTGVMLTLIYLLTSWRKNRWFHVAGAALLGFSARPLWTFVLHRFLGTTFPDTEYAYLQDALYQWALLWHQSWTAAARQGLLGLSELATFDSPFVVVLGALSLFWVPLKKGERFFGLTVIVIPVLCAGFFSVAASARGYLIYGVSLWFYCCLAGFLSRGLGHQPLYRSCLQGGLAALCLITHFAWSTAHLHYGLGPAKMYFLGWTHAWPVIAHAPAHLMSLTGLEKTPVLFGGNASLQEAGALRVRDLLVVEPGFVSFQMALARRALLFGYAGLWLMCLAASVRKRTAIGAAVGLLAILSAFSSYRSTRSAPWKLSPDHQILLPGRTELAYRVRLSPFFCATLRRAIAPSDVVSVHVLSSIDPIDVTVQRGEETLRCAQPIKSFWTISDPERLFARNHDNDDLTVRIHNTSDQPVWFAGWQREDLPGRFLSRTIPQARSLWNPGVLPAIEIRVCRPDGSLKLGGF